MRARVLVKVDRTAAIEAIRTLDALCDALREHESAWTKKLKRKYKDARRDLVQAIGQFAHNNGIDELAVVD